MKKTVFIAIACGVIIAACHNTPKNVNPGGFTITGTIKGMDTGWVFFGHSDSAGFVTDSLKLNQSAFTYTGKVSEPAQYYLWIKGNDGSSIKSVDFFVEDTLIQVQVDKDSIQKTNITGSRVEDMYLQYKQGMKPLRDKINALNKSYETASSKGDKAAIDSLSNVYDQLEKAEHVEIVSYVDKNPSSIIGAWAVEKNLLYDGDVKVLEKLYGEFTPAVQQSRYAKVIKKELDIEERMQAGMEAPAFTLNDTTGKTVSLASFRGKYVLVDFWASWCGPCRQENPNVVKAYNMYKDKNFTILGVSLDENKAAWEKAINSDGLTWNHVSDLKGWKNEAAIQYGIRAIPSNYLLNPEGKILAHNLRGEALEDTLAHFLK